MTENLAADAVGTYNTYTAWGATKVAAVAAPDNDDTDYLGNGGTPGLAQSYTLAASAIPLGSTINSVTVHGRQCWDHDPATTFKHFVRLGANEVYSAEINFSGGSGVWENFNSPLARPGGGPWQLADLATVEIGIKSIDIGWDWCTTLYAVIDYTPPSAPSGAMFLVLT